MNYLFSINDFEGPLDLLLHLIKINEMDIYDINIKEITEQYIEFINLMKNNDIDIASDYLLMASELVHIKSNNLIQSDDEDEEDEEFEIATKEELTKRLLEYQAIKELTSSFLADFYILLAFFLNLLYNTFVDIKIVSFGENNIYR